MLCVIPGRLMQTLRSARCRTRFILEYFGEPVADDWNCGNCDACDAQKTFAERGRRVLDTAG